MFRATYTLLVAAIATLAACTEPLTDLPNEPGGNPLVPSVPMLPFPSDFYLAHDDTTATGRRLVIPAEALPESVDPAPYATADGYSRIPAILAWMPGGFDPTSLPDATDAGATTLADSPVLLLREDTWEKVPVLAEIDQQDPVENRRTLILRPHTALDAGTGYVVVLRDTLRRLDGNSHTAGDAFRALRDDIPTDNDAVEAQRDDFELVQQALQGAEIDPESVVLAWSFHTRSRAQLETPLQAMHTAMGAADLSSVAITSDTVNGRNRLVRGTVTLPDFVGDDGITLDDDGKPVQQGTRSVPFLVTIPETVTTPRPVIAYGHGFFSSMEESTWSSLNDSLQLWQMSTITTNFVGFDEDNAAETATTLGGDLAHLEVVIDHQAQNQATFTAMARLVRDVLPALVRDGDHSPLDGGPVRYMGISNGGTQGAPIAAFSPELRRAVLVVPGGAWSHMLQRAVQWRTLGFILENRFDADELQLVVSLMQLTFDRVDSISFAERLVTEPFEGFDPLEVTLHEAVADTQVNNLVTHWLARSADIPLVEPSPLDVWGLDTLSAPPPGDKHGAALLIYDEGYDPLPTGNVPPLAENGAHESIRLLPSYKDQVGAFLEDGTIVQVCEGACDPQ